MSDFYNNLNYDYKFVKGDTINMGFELFDDNSVPIDILSNNLTHIKFTVINPYSSKIVIEKSHNDVLLGGKGVYIQGDTNAPGYSTNQLGLDTVNKIVVLLDYDDTNNLEVGVYPYDIEISDNTYHGSSVLSSAKLTKIKGNLIITREVTPSAI